MTHTHKRAGLGFFDLNLLPVGVSTLALYHIQLLIQCVILVNSHSVFFKVFKEVAQSYHTHSGRVPTSCREATSDILQI